MATNTLIVAKRVCVSKGLLKPLRTSNGIGWTKSFEIELFRLGFRVRREISGLLADGGGGGENLGRDGSGGRIWR